MIVKFAVELMNIIDFISTLYYTFVFYNALLPCCSWVVGVWCCVGVWLYIGGIYLIHNNKDGNINKLRSMNTKKYR